MNSDRLPAELPITLNSACALSVECWRLRRLAEQMMDTNAGASLRHAVRCITHTLLQMEIEVVDFAGRAYDPGMAPEVVEVREDQDLVDRHAIIEETIAPTVLWRGLVVRPGQVIVRQASTKSEGSAGVDA